jgi:ATP phosphoribosyltransferase
MTAPLVLAVPSKGRLQEESRAVFVRAGLDIVQAGNVRSYRGSIARVPGVEVAYLSAPEIAREIGVGAVHLGITGRDQVEESVADWKDKADFTLPLGFGHCQVVGQSEESAAYNSSTACQLTSGVGRIGRDALGHLAIHNLAGALSR